MQLKSLCNVFVVVFQFVKYNHLKYNQIFTTMNYISRNSAEVFVRKLKNDDNIIERLVHYAYNANNNVPEELSCAAKEVLGKIELIKKFANKQLFIKTEEGDYELFSPKSLVRKNLINPTSSLAFSQLINDRSLQYVEDNKKDLKEKGDEIFISLPLFEKDKNNPQNYKEIAITLDFTDKYYKGYVGKLKDELKTFMDIFDKNEYSFNGILHSDAELANTLTKMPKFDVKSYVQKAMMAMMGGVDKELLN